MGWCECEDKNKQNTEKFLANKGKTTSVHSSPPLRGWTHLPVSVTMSFFFAGVNQKVVVSNYCPAGFGARKRLRKRLSKLIWEAQES
jgi:hypothetical protein